MAKPSLSTAAIAGSLLLGTGVVVHDAAGHHGSSESAAASQSQIASAAIDADGPCAVIRRFGALRSDFEPAPDPGAGAAVQPPAPPACAPRDGTIQFLLATVPNPTQTRLGLVFDRYVESILAAVDGSGYTFHSYWLPWSNTEQSQPKSFKDQKLREAEIKAREREPGILLFRAPWHTGRPPKALAVLLISETPTSGIDEAEFHAAMTIAGDQKKVAIVGPSFSGSFWSLSKLLPQYRKEFSVVTGSATVEEQRSRFGNQYDFTAAIHDDRVSDRVLLTHVCAEWGSNATVAIISESATTYGSPPEQSQAKHKNRSRPDHADGDLPPPYNTRPPCARVISLTFPREISRLRNAYSEHPELAAPDAAPATPVNQLLPLDLRDPRPGKDSVPVLARTQTPISQEGVLQALVRALRGSRSQFALLRATDPFDVVFLARYLRANCPDVHILMETADVLFARAAREDSLDGTLTVTTYPLFPQGSRSRGDVSEPMTLFASRDAQGVYNAALIAIQKSPGAVLDSSRPPGFIGFERPFCRDTSANCVGFDPAGDMTWPSRRHGEAASIPPASPGLWITILSRSGYWPVAVIGAGGARLRKALRPTTAYVLSGCVLLFVFTVLIWNSSSGSAAPQIAVLRSAAISAAAAVAVVLIGPFVINIAFSPAAAYIVAAGGTLIFAGTSVAIAKEVREERPGAAIHAWIPCGALIAFAAAYLSIFRQNEHLENVFFAYRSLSLLNGVSPMLPMLLLLTAVFWWSLAHLNRCARFLWWRDEHYAQPMLASLGLDAPFISGLLTGILPLSVVPRLIRKTRGSAARSCEAEQVLATAICGSAFLAVALGFHAFEPAPYKILFAVIFAFVATAHAMSVWRFCRLWGGMRAFLRRLDSRRAREVFSAIGSEHSWSALLASAEGECGFRYGEVARKIQASEGFGRQLPQFQDAVERIARTPADLLRSAVPDALQTIQIHFSGEARNEAHSYLWSQREAALQSRLVAFSIDRREELESSAMELLALPAYEFILYLRRQAKNLLFLAIGTFVLASAALLSYPFFESGTTDKILLGSFIASGAFIIRVLAQADRNAVLSAMNGTEPGKLGIEFFRNVFLFGVAPLVTILAAYFPEVGRFLTSFLGASSLAGHSF